MDCLELNTNLAVLRATTCMGLQAVTALCAGVMPMHPLTNMAAGIPGKRHCSFHGEPLWCQVSLIWRVMGSLLKYSAQFHLLVS